MTDDKQALADITVFNKYAKFIPQLGRRENWNEIVIWLSKHSRLPPLQ